MKLKASAFFLSFILSLSVFATEGENKVVYGDDNREDIYEATNSLHKELASATAAMILDTQLQYKIEDNSYTVTGRSLQSEGICADAKFAKQITAASCSGFLVGDKYLVTAGHCIESMADCGRYSWVFDYANMTEEQRSHVLPKKNVYKCTEIISRTLDKATMDDYAFVKLDRVVEGRTPLKFRTSGKVSDKTDIVVIGHPSGLPSKIAGGAYVRSNANKYFFQANLDTFGGNSGSAVFDSATGLVEGILVRGERDYVSQGGCMRPKVCGNEQCRGEDVTRITNIKGLANIVRTK